MFELEITTDNIATLRYNNHVIGRYRCKEVCIKRPLDLRKYEIVTTEDDIRIIIPEK